MGQFREWEGDGRLLLETDDLIFRGASRLVVPLREISRAEERDGWLEVTHPGGLARFDLGKHAVGWANAISNPRSLIDKLDIRPDAKVAVAGIEDEEFLEKLRARTGDIVEVEGAEGLDTIIWATDDPAALGRIAGLRERIRPEGAIWVATPKGVPEIKGAVVIDAGRAAGLVDVKSARFSETHTAHRFVIPKAARGRA
jgi:hypothetical protein